MWWLVALLVLALVALTVALARRRSGGLGAETDAVRPPESFRIPGGGGGNNGGFAG